jgi:hypothetical protein
MDEFTAGIGERYRELAPVLDERGRRRFAAAEARAYGYGGVTVVSRLTGIARSTIVRGLKESEENTQLETGRVRRPGAGRKAKSSRDSTLLPDLKRLVEPATKGNSMRTLHWTSKTLRHLCQELQSRGHSVCPHVVADCLRDLGYSMLANRKLREGRENNDRDAQHQYINDQVTAFLAADEPVISVDTQKKELVGNFKNSGHEWHPKATLEAVDSQDFIDPKLARAAYGVYDIADNKGWASVGRNHHTASFAVHAIHRWWHAMGQKRFPKARRLMIISDGGGSNGYRARLWKIELQLLANEIRIPITVCHLLPGTSKWNKIEHRLLSFIALNSRGKPQRSFRTIIQLIAATATTTGLTVRAELDENKYPKRVKVSDAKLAEVRLQRHSFHGDWNYTISPQ